MKAIILARVSTKEQEETGHSLPAQIESLKAYAEKKDFEIVKTFSFSESAGPKIRKKFEEVLEYILKHKDVRVLLCENVDRATRNFRDAVDLDNLRRDEGLEIHFVKDGFFINREATGNQMFMWEAKVFIGKQYLNRLSDDVKRSNWARFEDHHWPGKAPRGYKNVPVVNGKGNTIIPSEDAFLIVKLFELYATGKYSHMTLRTMLYELGLKSEQGMPLSVSMIAHIIQNPFYYGLMRYNGRENTHDYESLISKSLFNECQAVRAKWNKQPFEYAAKPFALRGLATCKHCGGAMTGEVKKGRLRYYSCTNYRKNCKRVYTREETLLEPIYEVLDGLKMPQSRIDKITKGLKKLAEKLRKIYMTDLYKKVRHDSLRSFRP